MPTNVLDTARQGVGLLGDVYNLYQDARNIGRADPNYVDITAPGTTSQTTATGLGEVTAPLTQGIVGDARSLYQAGPAPLNPLQTQAYNQAADLARGQDALGGLYSTGLTGIIQGTDPATNRLAQQAAGNVGTGAALAGAAGSARAGRAAAAGAADVQARHSLNALGQLPAAQSALAAGTDTLNRYGQQYQNWQDTADWQNLSRYQQAIGFGQHSPQTTTTIDQPSGADVYNAQLAQQLLAANLPEGATLPSGGVGPARDPNIIDQLESGINIVDRGIQLWDTVSGWLAEGGEVKDQDPADAAWEELENTWR